MSGALLFSSTFFVSLYLLQIFIAIRFLVADNTFYLNPQTSTTLLKQLSALNRENIALSAADLNDPHNHVTITTTEQLTVT
jgi:hypothetical protein